LNTLQFIKWSFVIIRDISSNRKVQLGQLYPLVMVLSKGSSMMDKNFGTCLEMIKDLIICISILTNKSKISLVVTKTLLSK
jgi:hypothetical protein